MPQSCVTGCSLCCRYVAVPIDAPRGKQSIDQARWMVSHRDVWLTVDGAGQWHVQFLATCDHLDVEKSRCGIYADRFDICREHEVESCEATHGEGLEPRLFRTLQEFDAYLAGRGTGNGGRKPN
jgi:Fe-S-cluster containining protein